MRDFHSKFYAKLHKEVGSFEEISGISIWMEKCDGHLTVTRYDNAIHLLWQVLNGVLYTNDLLNPTTNLSSSYIPPYSGGI